MIIITENDERKRATFQLTKNNYSNNNNNQWNNKSNTAIINIVVPLKLSKCIANVLIIKIIIVTSGG